MQYGNPHGAPTGQYRYRNTSFKIGFTFLNVAALSFTLGFVFPDWDSHNDGLWLLRIGFYYYRNILTADTGTVNAIRAMESLGVICVWLSVMVELYQDVFSKRYAPTDNRAPEVLAGIAGGFGLIGIILYGTRRPSLFGVPDVAINDLDNLSEDARNRLSRLSYFDATGLGWAFILTTVSCILILISAVVMSVSRRSATAGQTAPNFGASQSAWQPWSVQQGMHPQGQVFPMQDMRQGQCSNAAQTPGGGGQPNYYVMNQGIMLPMFKQPPAVSESPGRRPLSSGLEVSDQWSAYR